MNKLTCSTLAIFLTGSVALASDGEWNSLEQEVNALASTLNSADGGPTVFGRVRTYYASQADGGGVGVDTGGWSLANMRLGAKGSTGGYGYKIQTELRSGTITLLDAYATFGIGDTMVGTFGQFKAGVARASRTALQAPQHGGKRLQRSHGRRDAGWRDVRNGLGTQHHEWPRRNHR